MPKIIDFEIWTKDWKKCQSDFFFCKTGHKMKNFIFFIAEKTVELKSVVWYCVEFTKENF